MAIWWYMGSIYIYGYTRDFFDKNEKKMEFYLNIYITDMLGLCIYNKIYKQCPIASKGSAEYDKCNKCHFSDDFIMNWLHVHTSKSKKSE